MNAEEIVDQIWKEYAMESITGTDRVREAIAVAMENYAKKKVIESSEKLFGLIKKWDEENHSR